VEIKLDWERPALASFVMLLLTEPPYWVVLVAFGMLIVASEVSRGLADD